MDTLLAVSNARGWVAGHAPLDVLPLQLPLGVSLLQPFHAAFQLLFVLWALRQDEPEKQD